MTKPIYILIASLSLMTTIVPAKAQQVYPITLETAIKLAGASNLTVREYQLMYQQALAEKSKANEWWMPYIYAGYATHYLHGAAMNTDGKIFTSIDRNNLWAGLGVETVMDFRRGLYPLLAAKQHAAAILHFSAAEKNQAILHTIETYYDVQTEQLKYVFLQQLVQQADILCQQIKVKVDAGLSYQSDYLLSQGNQQHLKIAMLQAQAGWQKNSSLLANLLNMNKNTGLISVDTSLVPLTLSQEMPDTTGYEQRPEYLGLKTELQSFKTLRKTETAGLLLPKLHVGMDNGAFGAYSGPVNNTYQLNAALTWSLPLSRLTYKGDLKQWDTKIALQENKVGQFKNQYQQEVTIAVSRLQTAGKQMKIAKQALQFFTEALQQGVERQKLGTAKAFEVFQEQQFLLQAQLDYLQAIAEYNKAQYALKVAKGELL